MHSATLVGEYALPLYKGAIPRRSTDWNERAHSSDRSTERRTTDEYPVSSRLDLRLANPGLPFRITQRWQVGQKWVLRPATAIFWMGVAQTRQGLPVRW